MHALLKGNKGMSVMRLSVVASKWHGLLGTLFMLGWLWVCPASADSGLKAPDGTATLAKPELALMPYPQHLQLEIGSLALTHQPAQADRSSRWQLKVWSDAHPAGVQFLWQHLQQRLSAQAGLPVELTQVSAAAEAQLQLRFQQHITIPQPGDDESYQLVVTPQQIRLQAPTSTGALYGVETLAQLLHCQVHCQFPALRIVDQPRFGWRGLLLDSARRFIPLPDLKRQLQGMASAKLNVLHWHLTDDQGWRFESLAYPKLTAPADGIKNGTDPAFYSQSQMRELVAYAAKLGIRVLPEIDLPGHASAIGRAYPELMARPGPYPPELRFGVFTPLLAVHSPKVSEFTQTLFREVQQIFPDPYLHIGGDEVKPDDWLANPEIRQFMQQHQLADAAALHADFNRRLAQQLQGLNRRMMGWDEVLHPDLPPEVLVQSWQGQDAVAASVRAGHATLLSAGYYLDQPMPTSYHYRNDPVAVAEPLPLLQLGSQDVGPHKAGPHKAIQLNFSLARLNHKAITGSLLLIPASKQQPAQLRWWVPGRGALAPRTLQQQGDLWQFQLDSWLGPGDFVLQRHSASPSAQTKPIEAQAQGRSDWQASLWLGNIPYPFEVTEVAVDAKLWQQLNTASSALTAEQRQLIRGGEAALWTELAPAATLDLKLWPRLYAVAERLWSAESRRDEDSMYQRLQHMDGYGARLGLQHQLQQQRALQQMAAHRVEFADLQLLSQLTEQSQYYSRHHLKTVRGEYRLGLPLQRFADALPAESLTLVRLRSQLRSLHCAALAEPQNSATQRSQQIDALQQQMRRWQQAANRLQQFQGSGSGAQYQSQIRQLAQQASQTLTIALAWLQQRQQGEPLDALLLQQWRQQLQQQIPAPDEEVMHLRRVLLQSWQHCDINVKP
jgi:hexosaminidase